MNITGATVGARNDAVLFLESAVPRCVESLRDLLANSRMLLKPFGDGGILAKLLAPVLGTMVRRQFAI